MAGQHIIHLTGSLDMLTASQWGNVLRTLSGRHAEVVVDAQNLQFIDSTGIGELISCARDLAEGGTRFRIQNLSPEIVELLAVMGVSHLLNLHSREAV